MKIKRFNNLWTMGLIIFGVIIALLYFAKWVFPELVIGVAEIPSVIRFGEYVDTHIWAYYLFNGLLSFVGGYLYICACCRKTHLSLFDIVVLLVEVIFLFVIQLVMVEHFTEINMVCMLLMAQICVLKMNVKDIKYMSSTLITFSIHTLCQIASAKIRDIATMISYPNSATFTILTIDAYIWLFLLYSYYNYKEVKKNG